MAEPIDIYRSSYPQTAEEESRNFEEFLGLTQPQWNESQIITAVDDHRVTNLGLPPLAVANLTQKIMDWIETTSG